MTSTSEPHDQTEIDWRSATWEGARREQMRRWATLPLERVITALEEMEKLSEMLGHASIQGADARGLSEAPVTDHPPDGGKHD